MCVFAETSSEHETFENQQRQAADIVWADFRTVCFVRLTPNVT